MAAHVGGAAQLGQAGVLHVAGPDVGAHHVVPQPHGDEDVRGHVLGVGGIGRDVGVGPRGLQAQGRVLGVVVGVDDVVGRARVAGVGGEDLLGHPGGALVRGEVPGAVAGAQDGQGVERLGLQIRREGGGEPAHGLHVERVPLGLAGSGRRGGRAVQHVHGPQVAPLPLGGGSVGPGLGRGGVAAQGHPGGVRVLLAPERVVVRHGLAPVGQREARVGPLRPAELFGRIFELEGVEQEHALEERLLGGRAARVREVDVPEAALLCLARCCAGEREDGEDGPGEGARGHGSLLGRAERMDTSTR